MANSFQQSVNSLMTNTDATENAVNATALSAESEVVEEVFMRDSTGRYKWYDEYIDNSYSKVDSQKNIAFDQSQINITQEARAQVIPFELNRYWDNVDLTNMLFKIHYVNPNNHDYKSTPINVTYSDNKIRFYWLIDEFATAVAGFLDFEIIATGTISTGEKYTWKTKPNKKQLNILLSLSGDKPTEINDDWYTQFVIEMDEKVSLAQEAATEAREIKQDLNNQLDALNAKVDTIEDDVKQAVVEEILTDTLSNYYTKDEAQAIANTAKQEAINAAAADATSKANQALLDAKAYTDQKVDALGKKVTANEDAISTINENITDINNTLTTYGDRLTSVENKVNSITSATEEDIRGLFA